MYGYIQCLCMVFMYGSVQPSIYYTVHPWIHRPPPEEINISWSKCATVPLKINILCTLTAPPSLELPNGCNGCRQGWGWGWGCKK